MYKDLLKGIEKSIKTCEDAKIRSPEYYKLFWEDNHNLLIKLKNEIIKEHNG